MTEFIAGVLLGELLVFCRTEYDRVKSRLMGEYFSVEKGAENTQWANLMGYDGTGRGQIVNED